MKLSIVTADIVDADAEAICTSTNPRLSLMMGTGAAVRERGGFGILRECEAIVEREFARSGKRGLPPGSAHVTSAGDLPHRMVIHCVASDGAHRSSLPIVAACVRNALAAARAAGCASIAMPLFATGHAGIAPEAALEVMVREVERIAGEMRVVVVRMEEGS